MAAVYLAPATIGGLAYLAPNDPPAAAAVMLVGADLVCTYDIEANAPSAMLVGADLVCSYDIEANPAAVILVGADLVCAYSIVAVPVQVGDIDATTVSPARTVVFTGGIRTVRF